MIVYAYDEIDRRTVMPLLISFGQSNADGALRDIERLERTVRRLTSEHRTRKVVRRRLRRAKGNEARRLKRKLR